MSHIFFVKRGGGLPKFNEQDRKAINDKLITEGKKLFCKYGLKKVNVNDLARQVGISHGSFYSFYECKEDLYIEIMKILREETYEKIEEIIDRENEKEPIDFVKEVYYCAIRCLTENKEFFSIDTDTCTILRRKIPKEIVEKYYTENVQIVKRILDKGVRFICSEEILMELSNIIFGCTIQIEHSKHRDELMKIVIDAILEKVIV